MGTPSSLRNGAATLSRRSRESLADPWWLLGAWDEAFGQWQSAPSKHCLIHQSSVFVGQ
jgi:hypothetical protein